MPNVVGAIRNLCQNSAANKDAVRNEGGIVGLVDLLRAGQESPAAVKAAETLEVVLDANAANERATSAAILEQPAGRDVLVGFPQLIDRLQKAAERVLMTAAERNDQKVFDIAMKEAIGLGLPSTVTDLASARAVAVREQAQREAARWARRESLGLGSLATPNEFLCPITQDVMIDPVVASDGHSYERSAIQAHVERGSLDGGIALSPLTREELDGTLVPNINLRKRIREHDNEVESDAQQVLNSAGGRPGFNSGGRPSLGSSSSLGSSASRPLADGPAMVSFELEALGLQRYVAAFEKHGYDSWSEIVSWSECTAQLDKLESVTSMAFNHADRLKNALRRQSTGLGAPTPSAESGRAASLPPTPLEISRYTTDEREHSAGASTNTTGGPLSTLTPAERLVADEDSEGEGGVSSMAAKLEDSADEVKVELGEEGAGIDATLEGLESSTLPRAAARRRGVRVEAEEGLVSAPSPSEQMVAPREIVASTVGVAATGVPASGARGASRKREAGSASEALGATAGGRKRSRGVSGRSDRSS